MSQIQSTYSNTPCLYIQEAISIAEQEKQYTPSQNGFTDFVRSRENISASPFTIYQNTDGKFPAENRKGEFKLIYYAEDCDPHTSVAMNACNPKTAGTTHSGKKAETFTVNDFVSFTLEINRDTDDRDKCYSIEDIKRDLFGSRKYQILAELERKIISKIEPTIGSYKGQTSPITSLTNPYLINMVQPQGGYHWGTQLMNAAFRAKKNNNKIHYIGQTDGYMQLLWESKYANVANTAVGQDITKIMLDLGLSDQLADVGTFATDAGENIVGLPFGAYQFLTWNRFVGKYEELLGQGAPGIEKTTMSLWGLNWDVIFKRDTCKDIYEFQLNFDIAHLPTIGCNDKLALNFLAGCGVDDCATLQTCLGL
jgi:hypothetical protein